MSAHGIEQPDEAISANAGAFPSSGKRRISIRPAPLQNGNGHVGKPANPTPTSIAVIDDRPLLRECMSMFLSTLYEAPINSCATADDFFSFQTDSNSTLIILGVSDQRKDDVFDEIARLRDGCAGCPVLLMIDSCDLDLVKKAIRKGARGVIPTNLTVEVATEAIGLVVAGGAYIPAECLDEEDAPEVKGSTAKAGVLTARELEVMMLLRAGKQNKQIAHLLGLSDGTVKVHIHNMMRKLGTTNRTETIMVPI